MRLRPESAAWVVAMNGLDVRSPVFHRGAVGRFGVSFMRDPVFFRVRDSLHSRAFCGSVTSTVGDQCRCLDSLTGGTGAQIGGSPIAPETRTFASDGEWTELEPPRLADLQNTSQEYFRANTARPGH